MSPSRFRCAAGVLFAYASFGAGALAGWGGPLDPPPGPITPTPSAEPRIAVNAVNTPGDADSLFKITQPGSYYLTGNITGVAGKHGVEITSSGVTLDLSGFDLVGVPGMGAFDGVSVSVDLLRDVTVIHGSVRDWGDTGVDLGFLSFGCRVEGVLASGNAGNGINAGVSAEVAGCTASFNGQSGVRTNNGSTISRCTAYSNSGRGLQVNNGCVVANCAVYQNAGRAVQTGTGCTVIDTSAFTNPGGGLLVGEASTLTRCSAVSNTGHGIEAGNACTIADCTANFNSDEGIRVGTGATISGSAVRSNGDIGIATGPQALIRGCIVTSSAGIGVLTSSGVVIVNCEVSLSGGSGAVVGDACTVADCVVYNNGRNGVQCGTNCVIRGNTCSFNGSAPAGGAGIVVEGRATRVEANNCTSTDRGIEVAFDGNIIIRNTCANNAVDWVIAANNVMGPILDRRGITHPAVNGFSSGTSLNTTDPHANFSY